MLRLRQERRRLRRDVPVGQERGEPAQPGVQYGNGTSPEPVRTNASSRSSSSA
jgi:hypothetical protein